MTDNLQTDQAVQVNAHQLSGYELGSTAGGTSKNPADSRREHAATKSWAQLRR